MIVITAFLCFKNSALFQSELLDCPITMFRKLEQYRLSLLYNSLYLLISVAAAL